MVFNPLDEVGPLIFSLGFLCFSSLLHYTAVPAWVFNLVSIVATFDGTVVFPSLLPDSFPNLI